MRYINFDNIPRKNGKENRLDWKNSIGKTISFAYEDINGEILVLDYYNSKNPKLKIKYKENEYGISVSSLYNCNLGKIVGKVSNNFKVEIGQHFKDDKRDLVIIDREYRIDNNRGQNKKWYKYHCNIDNNEDWIEESKLITLKRGCNTCNANSGVVKKDINSIWATNRWMCDWIPNEDLWYTLTSHSNRKIDMKCKYCGKHKKYNVYSLYLYGNIGCNCCDGVHYPNKFVYKVFEQLFKDKQIKILETEKRFCWSNKKQYDLFLIDNNDNTIIIENNGKQHYQKSGFKQSLEEIQNNDIYKKQLAIDNNISYYIELDCSISSKEFIKNSIINNEHLKNLFNLDIIDWKQCEDYAEKLIVKEVCDYWHKNREINSKYITTKEVGEVFNLNRYTIINYLKRGTKIGWCNYDPIYEQKCARKGKLI